MGADRHSTPLRNRRLAADDPGRRAPRNCDDSLATNCRPNSAQALAKMTREKRFRQLQWLYFLSKDRLSEMKPEEIAAAGPGHRAHAGGPDRQP